MNIGDIIYFGSDVYNGLSNNDVLFFEKSDDHTYKKGVACIYIGAINDELYFLPIFSDDNSISRIYVEPTKTNKLLSKGVVAFDHIIKKNFYYMEKIGHIPAIKLYEIYRQILEFYKNNGYEDNQDINTLLFLINEYIDEFEYCKKKGFYKKRW